VPNPETAEQAIKTYDGAQNLEAIPLLKNSPLLEQQRAWADVFTILRRASQQNADFSKNSYLQYESWCFRNGLSIPATPSELERANAVKGAAYSIMREGFSNYISRHIESPKIQIRKP
jgi:hypothetical protein